MCKRQHSWRWRWMSRDPRHCPFRRPNRAQLCQKLAGRRIALYGDSLTQQFFVALASLAGAARPTPRPAGCEATKRLECVRVCGNESPGLSADICQRTRFGLALDEQPTFPPHFHNCSISPSTVAPLREKFAPACIRSFDVVVLSEVAHWVGNDGALGLQQCMVQRGVSEPEARRSSQSYIEDLYRRQMTQNARYLRRIVRADAGDASRSVRRTRVFFRTSPTGYPTPDLLASDTPDGTPPVFTSPTRNLTWVDELVARGASRFNHHMIPPLNAIARAAFEPADAVDASGDAVAVMDVEAPMLYRVDGHLDPLHCTAHRSLNGSWSAFASAEPLVASFADPGVSTRAEQTACQAPSTFTSQRCGTMACDLGL